MLSSSDYQLIITDPALEDLESIAGYTSLRWGENQAIKYSDRLFEVISAIAENPDTGRSRYGVPEAIKGLASGRHIVFYRVEGRVIYIMRILHDSMDHGRHLQ